MRLRAVPALITATSRRGDYDRFLDAPSEADDTAATAIGLLLDAAGKLLAEVLTAEGH